MDAKSHAIGSELYRVEKYTDRLRQIRHKVLRPKLNQRAAGAFVRNALFDPDEQKTREKDDWEDAEDEQPEAGSNAADGETGDQDDSIQEKPAKRMRTN